MGCRTKHFMGRPVSARSITARRKRVDPRLAHDIVIYAALMLNLDQVCIYLAAFSSRIEAKYILSLLLITFRETVEVETAIPSPRSDRSGRMAASRLGR
jgi:hypothetical protein